MSEKRVHMSALNGEPEKAQEIASHGKMEHYKNILERLQNLQESAANGDPIAQEEIENLQEKLTQDAEAIAKSTDLISGNNSADKSPFN